MKQRALNPAGPTPSPVAIIGMGCLFPGAEDLSRYWSNIRAGRDAIGEVPETHWRPEDYFDADPKSPDRTYARRGGFLDPVDFPAMEFGIAPNNIDATDTAQLLGLLVARRALEDAGYGAGRSFDRDRVSVILGVTGTLELVIPLGARLGHPIWRRALQAAGVPDDTAEDVVRRIADSYVGWQENSFPGLLGNVAAGRIANRLDLGGTNCVIDAACASSLGALHLAMLELASGRSDMVLTGGLDTFNDIFMYMCFSKTPALSPSGNARPFDAAGDGTILGEGLGVLVLKRLEDARRDGDRIYAVIRGVGTSSDGKGGAVYAPKAEGQIKALRSAYAEAGISPETIELVEAHGTGTKVGDAIELEALEQVYRGARPEGTWCALGSVKSQIGHTKAAAGVAGLIKAALALHHKALPPTIKVSRPIEPIASERSPFYLNTEPRPWLGRPEHPRRAAVSAFGFGGSNFHCVLEEVEPANAAVDWGGDVQIVAFSARDREGLAAALERWPAGLSWDELRVEAARSRERFRAEEPERLLIVLERESADWAGSIRACLAKGATPEANGVFCGSGPAAGKLAMLFPGQGSQYVGMLRDLACRFPEMLEALERADRPRADGARLSERIYPLANYGADDQARHERALRETEVAQPAIGAVSLGLLGVLEHFGVRPDVVGGHSFGELTALCAAGWFDAEALATLARRRGELMAGGGDRGAMLAVLGPLDRIERVIREEGLDLVVANKNAPQQAVLSGPAGEIERAAKAFESLRIVSRPLAVSAAFHSRFVAEARGPLLETLRSIGLARPRIPVFANTTAAIYPDDPEEARALLAGQLAAPVEFVEQIRAMARWGASTFLEVGPDAKLTGLVQAILGDGARTLAVDASRGRRGNVPDLARTLARLAALGHPVRLELWDEGAATRPPERRPGLTVKVSGAHPTPKPSTTTATPKPTPAMKPTPTPANGSIVRNGFETNGDGPHPARNGTHPAPAAPSANGNPPVEAPRPTPQAPVSLTPAVPSLPVPAGDPTVLAQALRTTQENLVAIQRLSEQTAQLHRLYLEGQEKSQRTFQSLLEQQQRLVLGSLGVAMPAPAPAASPRVEPLPARAPSVPSSRLAPLVVPDAVTPPPAPAPAPVPAPAPAAVVEPPPLASDRGTMAILVEVVSEKTGYPAEMLEPGMQLDADLGIDSIKRVEILSALQERLPEAPVIKPEHLGTLRTLGQIVEFLASGAAANGVGTAHTGQAEARQVEPNAVHESPAAETAIERLVVASVALGEPAEREPVAVRPGGLFWIADDGTALAPALAEKLKARGYQARVVGVDEIAGLETPERLGGLILPASVPLRGSTIKDAFRLLRTAGPALKKAGADGGAVVVTVSRLGGSFGLHGLDAAADPAAGALAGLVKTARQEWPEVDGKAIDLDAGIGDQEAAALIVEEMLWKGPAEVGLARSGRTTLALVPSALNGDGRRAPLQAGDVVVVTGGARGVTAEVATALAEAFRPTVVVLGRSPEPEPEPDWLAGLYDEAAIKKALLERAGGRLTPQALGEQSRRVAAGREVRANLGRIEAAGGRAVYRSVDVRDGEAVCRCLEAVRAEFGPIRGVVHGAGVLADRRIEDKTDEQFALVYDTKVAGLQGLLDAAGGDELRVLVLFSSTTARFGRVGQVAYAAANEVLNKVAQREAKARPGCRVVSVNWGPWDGGMVTAALKKVFANEGIALIPPTAGARYLVEEIQTVSDRPVEVVVLGAGSSARLLDAAPSPAPKSQGPPAEVPATAKGRSTSALSTVFERTVDVDSMPVLRDHVIDGRPVMPLALMLEWLAQGALHRNPGLVFLGVDDLQLLKGVILREGHPARLRVVAGKAVRDGSRFRVPVELLGVAKGGQDVPHARAEVVLGDRYAEEGPAIDAGALGLRPYLLGKEEVYGSVLFHGPGLQGLERVEGLGERGCAAWSEAAPVPSEWMERPLRQAWVSDPLAIDVAFQLLILWCVDQMGAGSLPTRVASYRQFRRSYPSGGVRVVARTDQAKGHRVVSIVEFVDADGALVARMEGYECVMEASLNQAFRRNRLTQVAGG